MLMTPSRIKCLKKIINCRFRFPIKCSKLQVRMFPISV